MLSPAGAPLLSDGVFYNTSNTRIADIQDGLSGYHRLQRDDQGERARHNNDLNKRPDKDPAVSSLLFNTSGYLMGASPATALLLPKTLVGFYATPDVVVERPRPGVVAVAVSIMASYNNFYTPNSSYPDCTDSGRNAAVTAARSYHPGGVNSVFCDGHVQFAKNSVGLSTWRALSTRAGIEVVSGDAY